MAGAQLVTPNSLFQSLPASLLGLDTSEPANAILGQFLTNWLKQNVIQPVTGISPTDPIWSATLYTNMTDFGAMMTNLNSAANSRGISNMMQLQASARYQFLEGWQRTATSREAFAAMSPEERGGFSNYDAFIQHKTQGMMDNQMLTMLMTSGAWDPTGKLMASAYVRQASSNAAREAMWRGEKDFQRQADAVANVFLDDQLKLDYNKRDYGLMTMNESAAVLAAMTKNRGLMDYSPGSRKELDRIRADMNSGAITAAEGGQQMEAEMKRATQALRERLQGLTTAMSPLKDFFGDDVPNMIRFLEELTGKSFATLDAGTIQDLTRRVSNGMSTGLYTAGQLQAVSKQLSKSISQMDVPFYMDTSADEMAVTMLNTLNAGITPALMSDATFRNVVTERTMRHAASPFANNISLAYSNWKRKREEDDRRENQGKEEKDWQRTDTSLATFQAQYDALISSGATAEAAMLQLSRTSSIQQMAKQGYGFSGYEIAMQNGLGARMADAQALRDRVLRAASSRDTKAESQAVLDVYNMFTEATEDRKGMTTQAIVERLKGMENSTDAREQLLSQTFRTMSTDKAWMPLFTDLMIQSAQVDANVKTENAERIRARTEFISTLFGDIGTNASTLNEAIFNTLLGDRGSGMDLEKTVTKLQGKTQLTALAQSAGIDIKTDIPNIQTMLKVDQRMLDVAIDKIRNDSSLSDEQKEARIEEEKYRTYKISLANAKKYMVDVIDSPRRAAVLQPYMDAANKALESGRTDKEALRTFDMFQKAASLSTESLELFAAEELTRTGKNSGRTLRRFVQSTSERYQTLVDARTEVNKIMQNDKLSDEEKQKRLLDKIRKNEITVKNAAGKTVNIMDVIMPSWKEGFLEAQAADKKAGKGSTENVDALIKKAGGRLMAYIGQSESDFFFSEARTRGAYQKFTYGSEVDKAKFKESTDKALDILQSSMGKENFEKVVRGKDNQMTSAGQLAHQDFVQNVLSDRKSTKEWVDEHFKGYSEEARKNILQAYDTLLTDVRAAGPMSAESPGTMSIEDLMHKALGDGEIFRTLDKSINKLSDMLAQIPAFIKGAAEKWQIDMKG